MKRYEIIEARRQGERLRCAAFGRDVRPYRESDRVQWAWLARAWRFRREMLSEAGKLAGTVSPDDEEGARKALSARMAALPRRGSARRSLPPKVRQAVLDGACPRCLTGRTPCCDVERCVADGRGGWIVTPRDAPTASGGAEG